MKQVVVGIITRAGRVLVEQLQNEARVEYRGLSTIFPGGDIQEGESPETALTRIVAADIGISIKVEQKIAEREHPLFPSMMVTYLFCSVNGTTSVKGISQKIKEVRWVDLESAIKLMPTLYSQVIAFLIKTFYRDVLPQDSNIPKLDWLNQDIAELGRKIREGELVAFPTETVYGIGANAFNEEAVANIFKVKNRPADNPLIVHVSSLEAIEQVAQRIDSLAEQVLKRFMPGPITVLLPKNEKLPSIVTAGSPYVGVRIPEHGLALEFLAAASVPVAAPSANKSGKPSATHHQHVIDTFGDELPNVLRAGKTIFGLESTVVLPQHGERLVIMRQGAISKEELQRSFPTYEVVIASKEENQQVPTPGSKYRHYAPAAKVEILPEMKQKSLLNEIKKLYKIALDEGEKVGILCSEEVKKQLPESLVVLQLGSEKELSTIAANFFSVLIECDARKLTKVYVQSFSEAGIGRTIMERMRRAADV